MNEKSFAKAMQALKMNKTKKWKKKQCKQFYSSWGMILNKQKKKKESMKRL